MKLVLVKSKNISDLSTSSEGTERHVCFTATKSGQIAKFFLELTSTDLRIVSCAKGTVKMSLSLDSFHAKEMAKVLRTQETKSTENTPK